jgi:hypothetical protein
MAVYLIQDTTLTRIANTIRSLKGSTSDINALEIAVALEGMLTEVDAQALIIENIENALSEKGA